MTDHRYLSHPTSHMSKSGAVRLALARIREAVLAVSSEPDTELRSRRRTYTTYSTGKEPVTRTFDDLVGIAMETGSLALLRPGHRDPVFEQSFGLGCSENMEIESKQFGHAVKVKGPCQTFPIGPDLVRDILHYRREICEHSTLASIDVVARLYRAYVLSCTSLVEAFLNRYLWYFRAVGRITNEEFESFNLSFEVRLGEWLKLLAGKSIDELKAVTPHWGHLQELRRTRNLVAHAPDPTFALSLHDVHRGLNCAQTGVAGTLATLREWLGEPPAAFLEPLLNAPEVRFVTAMKKTRAPKHK